MKNKTMILTFLSGVGVTLGALTGLFLACGMRARAGCRKEENPEEPPDKELD